MISASELIINPDGSVFHLHLMPDQVADTIILVGDPARARDIGRRLQEIECEVENREFCSITGCFNQKRLTVVSTGIGCDNIDIVVTELDALVNVDFATRTAREPHASKQLTLVRLGTSGAVDRGVKIGDYLASQYSVGIDGLAYFYADNQRVRCIEKEEDFIARAAWNADLARPYVVRNSEELLARFDTFARRAVTISASGFYGPQGRKVRLATADDNYLQHVERAEVSNFEMEGAAIAFLGQMLGHHTLTVCAIIAQRADGDANADYRKIVDKLIDRSLEILTK